MKYSINIKSILIFVLISAAFSCGGKDNSIRVSSWKILQNNTDSYSEISSSEGWRPVDILSSITVSEPVKGEFKSVWLKGEFNIESNPESYYGISTGRIKYSDATYINSHFIDSQLPKKMNWVPTTRHYPIQAGVLQKGNNSVFIRLGIYDKYKGGIMDDIQIQPEKNFENTRFLRNLTYKLLPLGIAVMFAGLALILLINYISDRRENIFLYSIFPLLGGIIYILLPYFQNTVISYKFISAIRYSLAPLFSILIVLLFQSIYRIFFSNLNKVIIPVLCLFIITIFFTMGESYDESIGFIIILVTIAVMIPFFILMMYRLHSVNPDIFILFMVTAIFLVTICISIFELYMEKTGGRSGGIVSTFAPIAFIILGTIVSSREVWKRKKELNNIYNKLKKYEDKDVVISDALKEELNRVIKFIDENYRSDLSREGLASAAGIHPNYFSKLFKLYTGKTVNEYINSLRIDDAIRQLKKEDSKIFDIAFTVGYESLGTFNRVFKKVTGKTPSEYRDDV